MSNTNDFAILNNGVRMPRLGLGVYMAAPEETAAAVEAAIGCGYRLIDTAKAYINEAEVGEGIRAARIRRDELFVTTKLFNGDYGYDSTLKACDESLAKLGLDYLDLYLLHWPTRNWQATLDSYRALERLLAEGRVRAIGVCNFLEDQLDALIGVSDVVPAVNQVELHPYFSQKAIMRKNSDLGIVTEAWSPIGGVKNYGDWDSLGGRRDPLADPTVNAIARDHGRTAAQVILRWHLQNGVTAIPKSVHAGRIAENFAVFDFRLSDAEVAWIDALDAGLGAGPHPKEVDTDSFADRGS